MAAKKKTKTKTSSKSGYSAKDIIGFILIPVSFFMIFSVFLPGKTGVIGLLIRNLLTGLFSVSAYAVPIMILALSTNYIIEKRIFKFKRIYINVSLLLIILSSMYQMLTGSFSDGGFLALSGGISGGLSGH